MSHWFSFAIAIEKVPGKTRDSDPQLALIHPNYARAILLSYLDRLGVGGRRHPDSGLGCCHNSLRMSKRSVLFSIIPQPILTLHIQSLRR